MKAGTIRALFDRYHRWYTSRLFADVAPDELAEARRDFAKWKWLEPFQTRPLTTAAIKTAEAKHGRFPTSYRELLRDVGTGTLLCASEDEPREHQLVVPSKFVTERRAALSWISKDGLASTARKQKLDPTKMLPFMKVDDTTWVFLANQRAGDDRVFLFDHGFEGGYDRLFCPMGRTLPGYFRDYFQRSRDGEPLNAFTCWD